MPHASLVFDCKTLLLLIELLGPSCPVMHIAIACMLALCCVAQIESSCLASYRTNSDVHQNRGFLQPVILYTFFTAVTTQSTVPACSSMQESLYERVL